MAMDLEELSEVEFGQAPPPFENVPPPVHIDARPLDADEPPHPAGPDSNAAPAPAGPLASPPAPEEPISFIKPRRKVSANGNGNGHSNGDGAATPPGPAATQLLRLYLPRTNDFDADVDLMHRIDRVLRQSDGDDQVIIHMPNAAGTVLLKPRHRVLCSDALIGALRGVLGSESVFVEG